MILLIFFAFLSGVVTIFAPCIWPILPIVLSAGASGGERRPLGIVTGLMVSFTVFTLTLSYILKIIPIDPDMFRLLAVVTLSLLGVTLIVPRFGRKLEMIVSRWSTVGGGMLGRRHGFKGGFLTGFALGIAWSPCAGPILATVAAVAATQPLTLSVILVTLAFVFGVGLPLFALALLGRHVLTRTKVLSPYIGHIQQAFGVIMIVSALALYTGMDQVLQTKFSQFCSSNGITFFDRFQTNPIVTDELENLRRPPLQK